MPEFNFGFKDLADRLGVEVVGRALSEEIGLNIQVTTKGLMVYTVENGPVFIRTRATADVTLPQPTQGQAVARDIRGLLPRANPQNLTRRSLNQITMLVVHWDGGPPIPFDYDPVTYYQGEARFHINKDWGGGARGHGLMYHYKVSRDGRLWLVRDLEDIVWACMNANPISVNVCVDATHGAAPTAAQLNTVRALATELFTQRPDLPNLTEGRVWGHGELTQYGNATECPGPELRKLVATIRS